MNDNNSGTNTVLIVIVLLLVVGFGVWFLTGGFAGWRGVPQEQGGNSEFNLDVQVPTGDTNGGGGDQGGQGGQGGQ